MFECPYFSKMRNGALNCEGGKINFPDRKASHKFITKWCCDLNEHKNCPIYKMMDEYYMRKYPLWEKVNKEGGTK